MVGSVLFLLLLSLPVAAWPFGVGKKTGPAYHLQTGDIVFQATGAVSFQKTCPCDTLPLK